jgi:hypothetical protein
VSRKLRALAASLVSSTIAPCVRLVPKGKVPVEDEPPSRPCCRMAVSELAEPSEVR